MKNLFHILLFLLFLSSVFSQKNLNFYKKKYSCKSDTCAINAMIEDYKKIRKINLDSAVLIIKNAHKFAEKVNEIKTRCSTTYFLADAFAYQGDYKNSNLYLDTALSIAETNNLIKLKAEILNLFGINYSDQGMYEKSLDYYNQAKNISVQNHFKDMEAKANTNIGVTYYFLGDLNKAIEYYLKSLSILEELKDSANVSISLSNLSVFFQEKGQLDKSLEMLQKALVYTPEYEQRNRSDVYNNMAVTYTKMKNIQEAVKYYNLTIEMKKHINDYKGMAMTYHNLADIYNKQNDYNKAETCALKAIELVSGKDVPAHEANFLRGLANVYFEKGKIKKALPYILKSNEIALKIDNKALVRDNYFLIADMYRGIGDYKKSTDFMFFFQALNDTLQKTEFAENIAEMEAKYQNEKKQKEIELLQADKKNQELEIERRKLFQKALFIGLAMAVLLIIVVTISYFQKRKANRILKEKNEEISQQKEEITTQRDEILAKNEILSQQKEEIETQRDEILLKNEMLQQQNEEISAQRDEIEGQKHIIEEKNKEVMDSIHYALRIQRAILPHENLLKNSLSDFFIFYNPRDIVSGDFYWFAHKEDFLLVAAADCTGHGVPGAFMSMLGISFLNEIIEKNETCSSNFMLDELRNHIVFALQQGDDKTNSSVSSSVKDGMDIALVVINLKTGLLHFSGANNPVYVASPHGMASSSHGTMLHAITPDKQPIGLYEKMEPFTVKELQLQKGDSVYLFSDGIADQFGGPKADSGGKKFKYSRLKQLFIDNNHLSMQEQKQIIISEIRKWQGTLEQVDDMLLIGLKS